MHIYIYVCVNYIYINITGGGKMESSIVEQEEADEAEADPFGPNR